MSCDYRHPAPICHPTECWMAELKPLDIACDHKGKGLYWCRHCEPSTRELQEMLAGAYKFKEWVNAWLDAHGVPADADPKHTAETGCRISGRMEWLLRNIHLDLLEKLAAERHHIADWKHATGCQTPKDFLELRATLFPSIPNPEPTDDR